MTFVRHLKRLLTAVTLAFVVSLAAAQGEYPEQVVYVSTVPGASDANSGGAGEPFATLERALQKGLALRQAGIATRILIAPGVYREGLSGAFPSLGEAPITFEATVPGSAVISGADVWLDWTCEGSLCWHDWPYDWGAAENPWPRNVTIGELALRRELVIVDAINLEQVLSREEMGAGSFYVDEAADRIWAIGPTGKPLTASTVEVGVRDVLVRLQGLNDVTFRGLVFTAAASPFRQAAFDIVDQSRVRVDNVRVVLNGQVGLSLKGIDLLVLNSTLENNGSSGITGYQLDRVEIGSTQVLDNNWRGVRGGYDSWEVGQKFSSAHNVLFRDFISIRNASRGLWLDADVTNVVIVGAHLCDNVRDGLFLEAVQGPVNVMNSLICGNGMAGILTSTSANVELTGNVIRDNQDAQLSLSGQLERRVVNWQTGDSDVVASQSWRVTGNTIIGADQQLLVTTTLPNSYWAQLFGTSHFANNTYVQPALSEPFQLPNGRRADFAGWIDASGEARTSEFLRSE